MHEVLISEGFEFSCHDTFEDVIRQLFGGASFFGDPILVRNILNLIRKKDVIDLTFPHLCDLSLKSKLSRNTLRKNRLEYHGSIEKAFGELNGIEWIQPILQLIGCVENLTIIFYFSRNYIDQMDPRKP